ncbi:hypothetical protein [Lacticaseibacillus sp. N501-2]|uniref:hypothetical protein n=1 Tax=Lacticaseibacillus salsurae TaxID=3367729 RepID=UPI0038B3E987
MSNLMREYHIKLADSESEENLRAVLFGYDRLIDDLFAKIKELEPSFDTPSWYIKHFQLSHDQDGEIFMHMYQSDGAVHDNAVWLQAWFAHNVYEVPFEMAERMTRSYLQMIRDAKNYKHPEHP